MQALVKTSLEPGNVTLMDMPEPEAGPGQVKIRVEAAGICGSDIHILHSDIKLRLKTPVIMGHEFSGTVAAVGSDVTGLQPGDRVVSETTFKSCGHCLHCRNDRYNLCCEKDLIGYVYNGCFARYVVVPAHRVHPLPDNISFEEAALCEPAACCAHALTEQTHIEKGDLVLVAGVGSIGLLSAQIARALGAKVVICGTNADTARFAVARQLGLEEIVNVETEDPVTRAQGISSHGGADVFLECSGAPPAARMGLAALRRGGRYCQIGLFGQPFEFDLEQIAYKELQLTGAIGSKRSSWETALNLLTTGQISTKLLADAPLPLGRWQEAFQRFENKESLKVLLRPE